jgi:hypothetical protein
MGEISKHADMMRSGAMICMSSFVKNGSGGQTLT